MRLRKLELKDAPLMLEWMHDETVVKDMQADFSSKTLEDCNHFILSSKDTRKNLHLAIVDEDDEYMGTVSLKNIEEDKAEFAITVRKYAMGKGYSRFGMREIIKIGLEDMNLSSIYWYVDKNNQRAVKFYDKNGYQRISPEIIGGGYQQNLYLVSKNKITNMLVASAHTKCKEVTNNG